MFKYNKSSGGAAQLLLVLAVIVFVAIVITYLVVSMASRPSAPKPSAKTPVVLPVYEQTLGNIKFNFESATDRQSTLKATDITNTNYGGQKDLNTTERFIQVTIGAQNEGANNTEQGGWDIGNIIDSAGRNFVPDDNYIVAPWLPTNSNCSALLKPAFDPTPCTKIYEVSHLSTGLKIQIETGLNDNSANDFSAGRKLTSTLDLIVK